MTAKGRVDSLVKGFLLALRFGYEVFLCLAPQAASPSSSRQERFLIFLPDLIG